MKPAQLMASVALALAVAVQAHAQQEDEDEDLYNEVTIRPSDIPLDAPRFESYPAAVYTGANARPRLNADARTRLFRTRIKEWAGEKPNFAGHYILATWGCGTDCTQITIIDAKTGKVFHPHGVKYNVAVNVHAALLDGHPTWHNEHALKFRPDSRLLMLIGMPESDARRHGISYYVWRHNRLSLVRFVHKAWYP